MSPAWLGFAVFSPTTKLQQLIVSVLTRHCIPVFDVTERATCVSVGLFQPGLEGGGKVWVAVCLTTRQTVMKDGRHSRKKGGAAAIRVWKDLTGTFSGRNNTLQKQPNQNAPRTSATGWPAHIRRAVIWFIIEMSWIFLLGTWLQGFPPNKLAQSPQLTLSYVRKRRQKGRKEPGEAVGNSPEPWQVHTTATCV